MTQLRPWTFVLSEYLDLPFLLRGAGRAVVAVRSAQEALEYLQVCCPLHIVVDTDSHGADEVVAFALEHCPESQLEFHEAVIGELLAS
ncbi:MAG TPA: hypothetical protein VNT75_31630 [Symbiobacteriaceae bacterium]|nr:hypothetical protein [Symbiobacteriaceae bacterium]